jgi:hypothetical protein
MALLLSTPTLLQHLGQRCPSRNDIAERHRGPAMCLSERARNNGPVEPVSVVVHGRRAEIRRASACAKGVRFTPR